MQQRLTPFAFIAPVRAYEPLFAKKSGNLFLVQLPCPQCLVALFFMCVDIVRELILQSGDVEESPGPHTCSVGNQTDSTIHIILANLEGGQALIMAELKSINSRLAATKPTLTELSSRITKTETECSSIPEIRSNVDKLLSSAVETSGALANADDKLSDAEGRSHRCNLVFYGIAEGASETRNDSANTITNLCKEHLRVSIEPSEIERAHRVGKAQPNKPQPTVVRFTFFKTREMVLSNCFKFKGTTFSVGEDYSAATRTVRREFLRFARDQNAPFKLRYKKLIIGNKTYYFDTTEMRVQERLPI
ncbi:unnamed protein product [Ixodes hexagonus]